MAKISDQQIELVREVFKGRTDVVPSWYDNKKTGKKGYAPICVNKWSDECKARGYKCHGCKIASYKALDAVMIRKHFVNSSPIGVYPLLKDDTVWFIAGDFDNHDGQRDPLSDVRAFYDVCEAQEIPAHVEMSKGGAGYHIWWFFSAPVEAWKARAVYFWCLAEAGLVAPDEELTNSFDRMFPHQDQHSGKGFGNLIALPFVGKSAFLEPPDFTPTPDRWAYLSNIQRIAPEKIDEFVFEYGLEPVSTTQEAAKPGKVNGDLIDIDKILKGVERGHRDDQIFKYACRFRRKGFTWNEAEFFLCRIVDKCQQDIDDPFTYEDAIKKLESAWKYEPEPEDGESAGPVDESLGVVINPGAQQMADTLDQAWGAIERLNTPKPQIFKNISGPCIIHFDQDITESKPTIKNIDVFSMRLHLASSANWIRTERKKTLATPVPKWVPESMLAKATPELPYLAGIRTTPYFDKDGHLHYKAGYSEESKFLLSNPVGVGDIPDKPTDDDVAAAVDMIEDMLVDFPFASPDEWVHAVAMFLLPYCRQMIKGNTPLHLVEAPAHRTGKSLLVNTILYPFLGRQPATTSQLNKPEEIRKNLTTQFMTNPSYIFFDNIDTRIAGGILAEALTSRWWKDRLLQVNREIHVQINCLWVMTGNNPSSSAEMTGRIIRIKLDAQMARPGERDVTAMRHPDIMEWVDDNRPALVRSAIMLIQNWIAKGRPKPGKDVPPLGGFEDWRNTIGGVLDCAGLGGFLKNMSELYAENDEETNTVSRFVSAWWDRYGYQQIGVKELFEVNSELDMPLVNADTARAEKVRIGKQMKQLTGQCVAIFAGDGSKIVRIERGNLLHNAQQWFLSVQGGAP